MKKDIVHYARFAVLVAMVISAFCFADLLPYDIRSFSYGVSLAIREVVVFALPFVVFSIVFQSISRLQGAGAIKVVIALVTMIMLFNTASVIVAHFVGKFATSHMTEGLQISESKAEKVLEPFFSFSLPTHMSCIEAVLLGSLCGAILPHLTKGRSIPVAEKLGRYSFLALEKTFTPILPIFIVGLVFRVHSERIIEVLRDNAEVGLYFFIAALLHVMLMYVVASGFSVRSALVKFRSMIPPALFAFTTMSSLISMPLVQRAVKSNTKNADVVDVVLPTALNVHLVGDCFLLIIMAQVVSFLFPGGG
ncbi:cation:dicarboxylate symporter family transporter [Anaplasma platys]|uniref:cation:dicarboxylate symporter family transporter n=1 Tax=Anaplasma platys TaxID=949 RepID=UPI00145D88A1|nr:cation:dicarboxylase symporter family transporter [Anaplasma platys]